jgi:hypothetical protein
MKTRIQVGGNSISNYLGDIDFEIDCLDMEIKEWNKKPLDQKLLSLNTLIKDFDFHYHEIHSDYKKIIAMLKETHNLV